MIDQPFTQAQAGDETSRQLTGQSYQSLGDILNLQLQDALDRQKLGQKRSQLVQDFGSTVQGNVNAVRDLSQRVPGEAPSTLISSASDLGSSYVTAAQESAKQSSNDNVLSVISQIFQLQKQQEQEKIDKKQQEFDNEVKKKELAIKENQLKADLRQSGLALNTDGTVSEINPDGLYFQAKIDQLPSGQVTNITDLSSAIAKLYSVKKGLDELTSGLTGEGFTMGVTGPLATTIGDIFGKSEEKQIRSDLDTLKDEIRKGLYGSAFTETEKKDSKLFSSSRQEAENKRILESMIKNKTLELEQALKNNGLNNSEIEAFKQDRGIALSDKANNGVVLISPDGIEYKWDNPNDPEIQQALDNGYRRK